MQVLSWDNLEIFLFLSYQIAHSVHNLKKQQITFNLYRISMYYNCITKTIKVFIFAIYNSWLNVFFLNGTRYVCVRQWLVMLHKDLLCTRWQIWQNDHDIVLNISVPLFLLISLEILVFHVYISAEQKKIDLEISQYPDQIVTNQPQSLFFFKSLQCKILNMCQ